MILHDHIIAGYEASPITAETEHLLSCLEGSLPANYVMALRAQFLAVYCQGAIDAIVYVRDGEAE